MKEKRDFGTRKKKKISPGIKSVGGGMLLVLNISPLLSSPSSSSLEEKLYDAATITVI